MKITFPDGSTAEFAQQVTSAFAAMGRGEATLAQQKLVLITLFRLTKPFSVPAAGASDTVRAFSDGHRWVGVSIAQLIGGEEPWSLRHLGDVTND